MATVTSYTKAFMDTIVDATVVGAHVDVSGDLILEKHDGSEENSGSIYPSAPVLVAALLDFFYPIGEIKMSIVNTNPGTIIGGTWVAWGTGKVPVGVDTGQIEFDTVEETGGAKTHTLTASEMPVHTHVQNSHNHTQDSHNHTQNSHNHTQNSHGHASSTGSSGLISFSGGTTPNFAVDGGVTFTFANGGIPADSTATNQSATATNQSATATNQSATATNQNAGGDGAHNNLQPYITCYFWKRTA